MTFVVTETCINCKHTDCVEACPTDAFHEGPNFLVINPDLCVDCAACVAECPVEAIYGDADVPASQRKFVALNAELSQHWPSITRKREPLPEAAQWADVREKFDHLQHP